MTYTTEVSQWAQAGVADCIVDSSKVSVKLLESSKPVMVAEGMGDNKSLGVPNDAPFSYLCFRVLEE